MAITPVTLTANPQTLVGASPTGDVKVTVRTNVDGPIIDADANKILLGAHAVNVRGSQTFSASLPPTDGATNPTDFQYTVDLNYINDATRQRTTWNSGWFSLTANADLADVIAEQYVPPTYLGTAIAALEEIRDETQALHDTAVSDAVDASAGAASAAGSARDAAEGFAEDAQAAIISELTAAHVATVQDFWWVRGTTAPATTTMYGKPVLWVDESLTLTPTPLLPPAPTWNDAASTVTIPAQTIGLDYQWTSGTGHPAGTVLTPGSTVTTSGAFPRNVIITPVARPGYILSTTGLTYHHDFPDPAAVTIMTSDTFSGAASANFDGRVSDALLGGSSVTYRVTNGAGSMDRIALDGAGHAIHTTVTGSQSPDLYVVARNARAEFDLTAIALNGAPSSSALFNISIGKGSSATSLAQSANIAIGAQRIRSTTGFVAGGPDIMWDSGGSWPAFGTPVALGHYTIQIYESTLTMTVPDGAGGYVTRSVWLNPAVYTLGNPTTLAYNTHVTLNAYVAGLQTGAIANLVISKLGS